MALRAQANSKGRVRTGSIGGLSGVPGQLFGQVFGFTGLRGGLTNSLKGSVSAGAVLAGGLSLKRAIAGAVQGGATLGANLSGGTGTLRGSIPSNAVLMARLTNSLKGAVGASPSLSGALSLRRALAGNMPGGATFTSALTGAGGMPSGAAGIWYAKDYDSTNKAVPNTITVASTPVSSSILRMSTDGINLLGNFQYYQTSNVTVTDNYVDGPTGATLSATRLLGTGNCTFSTNMSMPASGSYVLCFDVKSNTGSSQSFRTGGNPGIGTVQTYTATTSWQRIVFPITFTSAAAMFIAWSPDGTTGWDLLIDNIQVFAGSSDLGRETRAGHLYFDRTSKQTVTTNPSTGVIDLSGNGSGIARFPSDITLTSAGFTVGAMVKRVATGAGYPAIFSKPENYGNFTAFTSNPVNTVKGSFGGQNASAVGVWDTNGAGWHLITHRYDGTYYDIFLDDARILHQAITPSATTAKNLLAGALNGFAEASSLGTNHQFNSWFLYPSALTTTQIESAIYPALKSRLTTDGQTYTRGRVVCAEGDSITADGNSYYIQSAANLNGQGVDYAVSGSVISDMVARLSSAGINSLIPSGSTGTYIMSVLIGANDLGGYAGATDAAAAANYTTALFNYYDSLRSLGFKVVACTILPVDSSVSTTHNARRAIVNANIRAAVGVHCDAVADFDTDAQMGVDNSYTLYPSDWTDGKHPNATGHARLAPIYYAAANSIT